VRSGESYRILGKAVEQVVPPKPVQPRRGVSGLFATHPLMSDRIERLNQNGTAASTVRQRTNRNSADERAVGGMRVRSLSSLGGPAERC
jgi:hypothetical protein